LARYAYALCLAHYAYALHLARYAYALRLARYAYALRLARYAYALCLARYAYALRLARYAYVLRLARYAYALCMAHYAYALRMAHYAYALCLHTMLYPLCFTHYAYPLMPTHAYAYPRHRRVVPKARNNLVNNIKQDTFFMVSLEWPNLANLKSEYILAYYPNRLEILCKLTNQTYQKAASATTVPKWKATRPQPQLSQNGTSATAGLEIQPQLSSEIWLPFSPPQSLHNLGKLLPLPQ
jgi:hypothetical protein